MKISLTKKNFLMWTTALAIVSAVVVGGFIKLVMPGHYFEWYPFIPVFFYVFTVYSIYMFDKFRLLTPKKMLVVYFGIKFVKMVLSLFVVLGYILFVKVHKEDLVVVFFLFYLLTMIFQTSFFVLYESNKMRQKKE